MSYTEEYLRKKQPQPQQTPSILTPRSQGESTSAYVNKLQRMGGKDEGVDILDTQIRELESKIIHLTKLHKLTQTFVDTQEQEYKRDRQIIDTRLTNIEILIQKIDEKVNSKVESQHMQDAVIEKMNEEMKSVKKQMGNKMSGVTDGVNSYLIESKEREQIMLGKMEDLASVIQNVQQTQRVELNEINEELNNHVTVINTLQNDWLKFKSSIDNERSNLVEAHSRFLEQSESDRHTLGEAHRNFLMHVENELEKYKHFHVSDDSMKKSERKREENLSNQVRESVQNVLEKFETMRVEMEKVNLKYKTVEKNQQRTTQLQDSLRQDFAILEESVQQFQEKISQKNEKLDDVITTKINQSLRQFQDIFSNEFENNMNQTINQTQSRFGKEIAQKLDDVVKMWSRDFSSRMEESNQLVKKEIMSETNRAEKRYTFRLDDALEQVNNISEEMSRMSHVLDDCKNKMHHITQDTNQFQNEIKGKLSDFHQLLLKTEKKIEQNIEAEKLEKSIEKNNLSLKNLDLDSQNLSKSDNNNNFSKSLLFGSSIFESPSSLRKTWERTETERESPRDNKSVKFRLEKYTKTHDSQPSTPNLTKELPRSLFQTSKPTQIVGTKKKTRMTPSTTLKRTDLHYKNSQAHPTILYSSSPRLKKLASQHDEKITQNRLQDIYNKLKAFDTSNEDL